MKVVSFHRTLHEVTIEAVTVEVPDDFVPSEDFDMPEAWADGAYAVHGDIVAASDWVYDDALVSEVARHGHHRVLGDALEAPVAQLPKGGGA
jgi:hypothetical protein